MANNRIILKRTSTSGRTPNTTGSYATNSQYIDAGELALNMADGILYSSNGSAAITVGANLVDQRITNSLTFDNDKNLYWKTVNTSAVIGFRQQNDDNFVFYSTNTAYGARPVFAIYANSVNSAFNILTPVTFNGNVTQLPANGTTGSVGQVLTANGSGGVYWSSVGGTGTVTSVGSANGIAGGPITGTGTLYVVAGNNTIFVNASGIHVNTAALPSTGGGGGGAPTANVIANTSFTAVKDNRYFLTNASPTTMILPSSPSLGDTVYVVAYNSLSNNIINRNGSNIMSLSENLVIDINYSSIGLTYVTATSGWIII